MKAYEQAAMFYLGRPLNDEQELEMQPLLYEASDLNTHAICVGMTGSGKTGLSIALLEEAAIDQVPAIIIDPKGDMANLALSFPRLTGADLLPYVQAEEAKKRGMSIEALAEEEAAAWRQGLADWDQEPSRNLLVQRGRELTVYTPGANIAEPLSILDLFDCPPAETLEDNEALADLISGTAASLLGLLKIEADPLQSKEHILLANILREAWKQGEALDLPRLIQRIAKPGFDTLGVMPLEDFYPEKERQDLALRFNKLLASPSFAAWLEGHPMDIDSLLYSPDGKPRHAVISLAHLSEEERMFFVSLLLNKILAWTRRQAGTSSLRALLYMDEIFGYFPPVKNPPSKEPLLSLLKQGRAYGLSVVLATQNPVDLDYKGLANMGTWFIGRLQTEGDKARLLDGLEGAGQAAGSSRQDLDRLISSLPKRCFLMHNIHEGAPMAFKTRHTLSYLRGPMTRADLRALKAGGLYTVTAPPALPLARKLRSAGQPAAASVIPQPVPAPVKGTGLPAMPEKVPVYFLHGHGRHYEPMLMALTDVYFKRTGDEGVEEEALRAVAMAPGPLPVRWEDSEQMDLAMEDLDTAPVAEAIYETLPALAMEASSYKRWERDLQDYLYRNARLRLYQNRHFKLHSELGESKRDFVVRIRQLTREERDAALEALQKKYSQRLARVEERIRKAEQAVEREEDQARDAKQQSWLTLGSSILGTLFSSKKLSSSTVRRAAMAGRGMSRAGRASSDVGRAKETLDAYRDEFLAMEKDLDRDLQDLAEQFDRKVDDVRELELKPLKRDCRIRFMALVWVARA